MSSSPKGEGKKLKKIKKIKKRKHTMAGYLQKQNPTFTKTTKKRWFHLVDFELKYFAKDTDSKPCGVIDLNNVQRIYRKKKEGEFGFVIVTPKREYILYASSDVDRNFWVSGLRNAISQNKNKNTSIDNDSYSKSPTMPKTRKKNNNNDSNNRSPKGIKGGSPSLMRKKINNDIDNKNNSNDENGLVIMIDKSNLGKKNQIKISSPRNHRSPTPPKRNSSNISSSKNLHGTLKNNPSRSSTNSPKITRKNSIDLLKSKMDKLEMLELDLKKCENLIYKNQRGEMRLLLMSLNKQIYNESHRTQQQKLALEADQLEQQRSYLESKIKKINKELQVGINEKFNWEQFSKAQTKKSNFK